MFAYGRHLVFYYPRSFLSQIWCQIERHVWLSNSRWLTVLRVSFVAIQDVRCFAVITDSGSQTMFGAEPNTGYRQFKSVSISTWQTFVRVARRSKIASANKCPVSFASCLSDGHFHQPSRTPGIRLQGSGPQLGTLSLYETRFAPQCPSI